MATRSKLANLFRPENNGVILTPLLTRESIAKQHHVSESTIKRDVQFGRAVNATAKAAGNGARDAILKHDVKIGREEVQKSAEIAKAQAQRLSGRMNPPHNLGAGANGKVDQRRMSV